MSTLDRALLNIDARTIQYRIDEAAVFIPVRMVTVAILIVGVVVTLAFSFDLKGFIVVSAFLAIAAVITFRLPRHIRKNRADKLAVQRINEQIRAN